MPSRRGWGSLSQPVRRRYERAGITESDYSLGVSLSAARGHSNTPERPERAESQPDRYRQYLRAKDRNPIRAITENGVVDLIGLSRSERSLVGAHDNAVRHALSTSEIPSRYRSILSDFTGRTVEGYIVGTDELTTFTLATDAATLEWLEGRGELRFESIYPNKAA